MKASFLLLAVLSLQILPAHAAPTLFFQEGWNLNAELCPSGIQDPAASIEALPKLTQDWKDNGQIFLAETETLVGHPWGRQELTFFHHVCPDLPDTSSPPSIQMAPLLAATTPQALRETLIQMRDTVWHELLHGYINDLIDVTQPATPLLARHSQENGAVLSHLHLMALQQLIYAKVGRAADAAKVRAYYQQNLPDYFRAWELARTDGPQAYLAELRAALSAKPRRAPALTDSELAPCRRRSAKLDESHTSVPARLE